MVSALLVAEVRSLPPQDRWDLIDAIHESLEDDSREPSEAAVDLAVARAREWRAGRLETVSWSEFDDALDWE